MSGRTMKDWAGNEFLSYARANLKRREFRKRMKDAGFTKWDERDLANLICLEATGESLDIKLGKSPVLDTPGTQTLEPTPIEEIPTTEPIAGLPKESQIAATDDEAVLKLYDEYLKSYEMPEPNDRFMVKNLCRVQVALDKATRNYLALLDVEGANQSQLKNASAQVEVLTNKVIAMQNSLGIDKPSRGADEDSGQRLLEYAAQARHVLHRQGMPLICVGCARSTDKVINQFGILLWHFQFDSEWEFTFICPRCGQRMTYNRNNVNDIKLLAHWSN